MKKSGKLLFVLHYLVGVGALFGGYAALSDPQAPLGIPAEEALMNSPFSDFLVPGIILFVFLGLGNGISGILYRVFPKVRGYTGCIFGMGLMIWIIVQCIMLRSVVFLHVIFFVFGLIQTVVALVILYQNNQFPIPLLTKLINPLKDYGSKSKI